MKKILALFLAASMLLCFTACSGPAEPAGTDPSSPSEPGSLNKNDLIGIVLPTKEESRWLGDQTYFQSILGDGNYNYEILFSQNNSATEKTNVETLISKGAKIIVLCAFDATAAAAAVRTPRRRASP